MSQSTKKYQKDETVSVNLNDLLERKKIASVCPDEHIKKDFVDGKQSAHLLISFRLTITMLENLQKCNILNAKRYRSTQRKKD